MPSHQEPVGPVRPETTAGLLVVRSAGPCAKASTCDHPVSKARTTAIRLKRERSIEELLLLGAAGPARNRPGPGAIERVPYPIDRQGPVNRAERRRQGASRNELPARTASTESRKAQATPASQKPASRSRSTMAISSRWTVTSSGASIPIRTELRSILTIVTLMSGADLEPLTKLPAQD